MVKRFLLTSCEYFIEKKVGFNDYRWDVRGR